MTPGQPHLLAGGVEGHRQAGQHRSPGPSGSRRRNSPASASTNAAALRWGTATPLGVPVVPDVKMIHASSPGAGAGAGTGRPHLPPGKFTAVAGDGADTRRGPHQLGTVVRVIHVDGHVGRPDRQHPEDGQVKLCRTGTDADTDPVAPADTRRGQPVTDSPHLAKQAQVVQHRPGHHQSRQPAETSPPWPPGSATTYAAAAPEPRSRPRLRRPRPKTPLASRPRRGQHQTEPPSFNSSISTHASATAQQKRLINRPTGTIARPVTGRRARPGTPTAGDSTVAQARLIRIIRRYCYVPTSSRAQGPTRIGIRHICKPGHSGHRVHPPVLGRPGSWTTSPRTARCLPASCSSSPGPPNPPG